MNFDGVDISKPEQSGSAPLLQLQDLALRFRGQTNDVVDAVSLTVRRGEVLCVVGESGCGKA